MRNDFQLIQDEIRYSDKLYLFLQNVFNVLPEDKFFNLINSKLNLASDDEIYSAVQKDLATIKPFLADVRYGLPALFKQKQMIASQSCQLLGHCAINSYLEIGTVGRYIPNLRKQIKLNEQELYVMNDVAPSFSPLDILDRGQISNNLHYLALDNYSPITLANNSLDLISCYIGLHHIILERLEPFITSIASTLKKGGKFILRDHDCTTDNMCRFVSLIHSVFNIGSGVSLAANQQEFRHFRSLAEWIAILQRHGLSYQGVTLFQDHDPSDNGLMLFIKE